MRIIHLTDLHAEVNKKTDKKWKDLRQALIKINGKSSIKALIVTGDFTVHGSREEFAYVGEKLRCIMDDLELKENQVFFCRGNHDSDTAVKSSEYHHYKWFLKHFFQKVWDPEGYRPMGKNYGVISFNSCTETSLEQFDDAVLTKRDIRAAGKIPDDGRFHIGLIHHQPEVLMNREELAKLAGKIDFLLSGHLHSDCVRLYEECGIPVENGIGLTPHLPELPSGFQLLKFKDGKLVKARGYVRNKKGKYVKLTTGK